MITYGYMECYIYCNVSKYYTFTFTTDDVGVIWLNDNKLGQSVSCQAKSVSGTFKKGLNHLEIMWHERSGGDGGCTNQTWQDLSWVDWVYANYKNK